MHRVLIWTNNQIDNIIFVILIIDYYPIIRNIKN